MPKIVINEYDKTTSLRGEYTNFTVVVPGPVSDIKTLNKKYFDVNGICELHTQKDFVDAIGKISGPKFSLDAEEPVEKLDATVYTLSADNDNDKLAFKNLAGLNGAYYLKEQKTADTKYGYLESTTHKYTKITNDSEFKAGTYVMLKSEGNDVVSYSQYGNQIAYELLGLGYTVLYKAFDKSTMGDLYDESWWSCLNDKAEYDFRYILTGIIEGAIPIEGKTVASCISKVSSTRQDCVALLDIDKTLYKGKNQTDAVDQIEVALASMTDADEYSAIFAPSVTYNITGDSAFENNKTFPASFHYLACNAKAAENYSEWYAIAGYTRGVSKYAIESVGCVFGEAAIDALEPRTNDAGVNRSVNLIVKIKNNYYLWGNRTAAQLNSKNGEPNDLTAKHFLNIRQLCTTIKKQVYVACRRFTFDPNSDILWLNFCNAIKPTLEKMRADQGIADYKLIKVKAPQKAALRAKIRIVPIEAVEDFEIDLYLEDSLNGTVIAEQ